MEIQVTNNILNLAALHEKLENTVFDHIDTSQNWQIAINNLSLLNKQLVEYFESVLERTKGRLPKSNPYWALFLDNAAKITFFYYFAKQHIEPELDEATKATILEGYVTAARLLPNNLSEENEELVGEIQKYAKQLDPTITIPHEKNDMAGCIRAYHTYIQSQLS